MGSCGRGTGGRARRRPRSSAGRPRSPSPAEPARPATCPPGGCDGPRNGCEPTVDWRQVLGAEIRRGLARSTGSADYTFAHRSRRSSAAGGFLLPGTFRPSPRVAVVIDTSGSMEETRTGDVVDRVRRDPHPGRPGDPPCPSGEL